MICAINWSLTDKHEFVIVCNSDLLTPFTFRLPYSDRALSDICHLINVGKYWLLVYMSKTKSAVIILDKTIAAMNYKAFSSLSCVNISLCSVSAFPWRFGNIRK